MEAEKKKLKNAKGITPVKRTPAKGVIGSTIDKIKDVAGDLTGTETAKKTKYISLAPPKTAGSTKTEANSGTRSSPPRVVANGRGQAKDTRSKSAAAAKKAVSREGSKTKSVSRPDEKRKR